MLNVLCETLLMCRGMNLTKLLSHAAGGAPRVPRAPRLLAAGQEPRHQDNRERDNIPRFCQVGQSYSL